MKTFHMLHAIARDLGLPQALVVNVLQDYELHPYQLQEDNFLRMQFCK